MYHKIKSHVFMAAWILGPSVLWSFVFQQLFFCIDPLLIHPVERQLPRPMGMLLRCLWIIGFAGALLFAWNIPPQSYAFYVREALPFSPASVLVSLGGALVFLTCFMFYRTSAHKSVALSHTMLLSGLLLLALKSSSAIGLFQMGWVQDHVRSPVLGFGRMLVEMRRDLAAPVNEAYGATFYSFIRSQPALPPKVVLMVVESWGESRDSLQQMVTAMRSARLQVVSSGLTTYRGSTLSGEFRELCAKDLMPTDELRTTPSGFDCAPSMLHRQGYQVSGLHGYKRFFYARGTFWTRFGIPYAQFREDMEELPQCPGPFEGICDTALIKRAIDLIGPESRRHFVYLLTLSSHEPIAPSALEAPLVFFRDVAVAHPTQVVARRAISDLIVQLDARQDQPCTLVYLAGDHQPPSAAGKSGIFETNKVPFVAFKYNCPVPLAAPARPMR